MTSGVAGGGVFKSSPWALQKNCYYNVYKFIVLLTVILLYAIQLAYNLVHFTASEQYILEVNKKRIINPPPLG